MENKNDARYRHILCNSKIQIVHIYSCFSYILCSQPFISGQQAAVDTANLFPDLEAGNWRVINHPDYPKTDDEKKAAVECARASIRKGDYHLLFNNCEHFVTEVLTGKGRSRQAERVGPITHILTTAIFALKYPATCK